MFERFTDRARRALVLAEQEARGGNAAAITPGHLLLGIATEGTDGEHGAGRAALALGPEALTAIRSQVVDRSPTFDRGVTAIFTEPTPSVMSRGRSFTAETKAVLEQAMREALMLGQPWVGTEHLLLALVRAGTVDELGLDGPAVRQAVVAVLRAGMAAKGQGPVRRWEYRWIDRYDHENEHHAELLLETGWEPFAAEHAPSGVSRLHLRRRTDGAQPPA